MNRDASLACLALCVLLSGIAHADSPAASLYAQREASTVRNAGGDERKQYFLRQSGVEHSFRQEKGLVLVLPGGDGSADNLEWVGWIARTGIPEHYLVAQLVAPLWLPEQQIVWPTDIVTEKGVGFPTHVFIDAVIDEVTAQHRLDPRRIYILCWSSSGPASYSYILTKNKVRGAIVAASIFRPEHFPPLSGAKDKYFYLLHSREDTVVKYQDSESARDKLSEAGAAVFLKTYEGEHGEWGWPKFQPIREAMSWLESQSASGRN